MSVLDKEDTLRFVQHRGEWYVSVPDLSRALDTFEKVSHDRANDRAAGAIAGVRAMIHKALAHGHAV